MSASQPVDESLRAILKSSSVQFADVAAGLNSGLTFRFRYTSDATENSLKSASASASASTSDFGNTDPFDRRYLIASITKPVVATMAVQLAAEGHMTINEPVRDYVEGFHRGPLRNITIRQLLTHTSGLPDMLPNNNELRMQHATLADFVAQTVRATPEFLPGSDCRYSSMGIAVLAIIMERMTDLSIHDLMSRRLFQPLDMKCSWLGLPIDRATDLMPTVVPSELPLWQDPQSDWNWNSRYWRGLGAPWGGMISTAEDLGLLAIAMLQSGRSHTGQPVLSPAAVHTATQNQTRHMTGLSEADRVHRPWGLGWRFNWPDHSHCFSDFLPPDAFGHWGATGTMMWIDPNSRRWCVILTNQPYEESQSAIQRMSNVIAASGSADD